MDGERFDDLARRLAQRPASRRGLFRALAAGLAALATGAGEARRIASAQTGCPPDQVRRPGIGCVCRATGRPPGPEGCPCSSGRRRCTPTGPCVQCCGNGDCPGTPCLNGICGCPSGQKLCRGQCILNSACCEDVDCEDGDPCTIDTCQSNRTCLHTPVADGQAGACGSGQVCCGGGCEIVATFCPPEQTFAACQCTCPGATFCGDECCSTTQETCLGGTASGACCANTLVCESGATCCTAGQACCGNVCVNIATFCPAEQTFSNCTCTCPGATICGPECCVDGQEVCIDASPDDFCCPTPRACFGNTGCCQADEACCVVAASETCVETATFCPPAQTFAACACTCPGATICGVDCCVSAAETCLNNATCCATADACEVDSAPDECCTGSQVCGGGTEGCCLPADAGDCAGDGDCCAPNWCEVGPDLCRTPRANGLACDRVAQCDSGFCCPTENVCGVAESNTCDIDTDCCGDLWCHDTNEVCVQPLDVGATCNRATQCEVGNCCVDDDVCGVADSDPCTPANDECCPGLACRGNVGVETCQPNQPPVADSQTVANGNPVKTGDVEPITITLTGSDPNGDNLTFTIVTNLPAGAGTLGPIVPVDATSATVEYTPPTPSIAGQTVSFTFKVNDGTVDSLTNATVEIQVFEEAPDASYTTVGNTELVVDTYGTIPTTPHVTAEDGVLAGTTTLTVDEPTPITTAEGGTVVFEADGDFRYTPPVGFTGTDSFEYTVNWGGTGTVEIAVGTVVWYVNNAGSNGDGRSHSPFNSLAGAQTASLAGQIIFVYRGTSGTTAYGGGITLKSNQQLIGEGVALVVDTFTLVAAGLRPQLTNAAGAVITLASDNTVRGLDVVGPGGAGIVGTGLGAATFTANTIDVTRTGGPALDLDNGAINATFGTLSSTDSDTTGIDLTNLASGSSLTVTGTTTVTNAAGTSINLSTIGSGSSVSFGTTSIATRQGAGIAANAVSGTLGFGAVTIPNPNNAAGNAISISSSAATTTFASVDIDNPVGAGIALTGNTGAVTVSGGDVTGAGGPAVDVDGQSAGVTYNGTITNSAGLAVEVTNRTGGTVSFGGAITDAGATNAGISLGSNAGTITFTAAVSLTDTSAAALAITGGTATISFSNLTVTQTNGQPGLAATNVAGGSLTVQGAGGINVSFTGTDTANDAIVIDGTGAAYDVSLASVTINTNDMRHGLVLGDLGAGSDVTITTGTITSEGSGRRVVHFPTGTTTNGTFNLSGVTLNGNSSDGIALGSTQLGTYQFGNFDVNTPTAAAPTNGIGVQVTGTTASVTFASIDQTGGATAIAVTNLGTGGSVTVNGGAIANTAVAGVDVNQGAGTISIASTITNTAGRTAQVQNRTGGTVTLSGTLTGGGTGILVKDNATGSAPQIVFSGTTKTISTGTNAAVTLDNNDGATVTFSGGGLDIDTTSGIGFDAKNGAAAINVTGSNNSITSTTGVALSVVNSNIGGSGLTFRSISAGTGAGGPASGIVLNSTGTSGGLTVTGDGTNANNGTGGTIRNTTSDGVVLATTRNISLSSMIIGDPTATAAQAPDATTNIAGDGISMTTVDDTTLRGLKIARTGAHGIDGTGVTNLTVSGCEILNAGDGNEENGLAFDDFAGGNENNLDGTVLIENTTIVAYAEGGIVVENFAGTLTMTVTGCTIGRNANTFAGGNTFGEEGIQARADGSSRIALTVNNTLFDAVDGNAILFVSEGTNTTPSTLKVTNSTIQNTTALGIVVFGGTGDHTSTIESKLDFAIGPGVSITNSTSTAVSIQPNGKSTVRGIISGVTVNGSTIGRGIEVLNDDVATGVVSITNNSVSNTAFNGIFANNGDSGKMDIHIRNNTVSAPLDATPPSGLAVHGVEVNPLAEATTNCLDIAGNTSAGNAASGGAGYRTRQRDPAIFQLERLTGSVTDVTNIQNFLVAQNTSGTGSATVGAGYTAVADGFCADPPVI